ncbi:MAG: metallophosphoesterase, partial [Paludibacteraceae bacterium]|nr:metallophosphoesterase [Paludibacteraceae bacterium]
MRRIIFSVLLVFAFIQAQAAERKEIHILSVNDVHAKVENFPQLAAIVDSLRAIDPQLLVMSAGDNRTGNPVNDQYEPVAYPMVALMNIIGFDCSTFGNHEFDSRQAGLAKLISLSNFPHVCAN